MSVKCLKDWPQVTKLGGELIIKWKHKLKLNVLHCVWGGYLNNVQFVELGLGIPRTRLLPIR